MIQYIDEYAPAGTYCPVGRMKGTWNLSDGMQSEPALLSFTRGYAGVAR